MGGSPRDAPDHRGLAPWGCFRLAAANIDPQAHAVNGATADRDPACLSRLDGKPCASRGLRRLFIAGLNIGTRLAVVDAGGGTATCAWVPPWASVADKVTSVCGGAEGMRARRQVMSSGWLGEWWRWGR
jgi:hypothetical protein